MYLKSIEMQGFKSFAMKTKLEFDNGVTGIVGPNGSGKSNVGDAVRWVLGEQSAKQLRGGNMQDVIFAGTQNRKPLGFASVAITLDNADRKLAFDADEVTVTRKLYRSGESEYLLNGRNCRLRDINELFYDTGIGKEGYSIIGQGQIEKILSGKPEERRELFDEAAGIVKFKRRKATSLKKLSDEQSNLIRVNDILSEVTRQLGPLEGQAKKAEEYLTKRDSLRTMDIQLFQIDEKETETQLSTLGEKKQIAENQLTDLAGQLEKTRQEYEDIEVSLAELDQKLTELREQNQKDEVQKQQYKGQIDVLMEQIRAAETNSRIFGDRMDALEADRAQRQKGIDEQLAKKEEIAGELARAKEEKEAREAEVTALTAEIETRTAEAEKGRMETISLLNSRSSIREKIQRFDTMLEQIEIRKAELSSRMLSLKGNADTEREKLTGLEEELRRATAEADAKREKIKGIEEKVDELKTSISEDNRKLEAGQSAYHRDASRLESLKHITERYEGYGNSIRKVMELKDRNPGIHGVIADLIKTDKKYEMAIETALGGALQNIVTDNEATAKYLIEYLKRGHFGRATFLPLTAMREENGSVNAAVLKEAGVLGKADELVRCEEIYRGVMRRLLGRTVVVDTIDHAIAVSRRYHQSVRMVTLEGELLSPGGSMTGGSFKFNNNLLGRRREIEDLEKSAAALKKETEELQKKIREDREARNELRDSLTELGDELQKLALRQNTAKVNYEAGKKRTLSLEEDYEALNSELTQIKGQVADIKEQRQLTGGALETSEKEEEELKEKIRRLSEEQAELQKKSQNAAQRQDEARLAYSSISQQMEFIEEKIRTAGEEIQRLAEEEESIRSNMADESGNADKRQQLIDEIKAAMEELDQRSGEHSREVEELLGKKEEMSRSHHEFFSKRDELSSQKSDMDQELFRLGARMEKLQEARENQITYLYEEYQMTPDEAENLTFEEVPERGVLKKQITGLRSEIKTLGNINVNAIEEYKELKERHDFLQGQHDDLIQATENLQEIIRQLDEGMRNQFREKFAQIRTEFDKVFKLLFGGGKGTLELVEDEDILESGILIISQPPGKKLQNMMQLSGGEKALTAIALLFAIQNLKPSPFCLLDEIEAALDDNNVGRFASYLHKLTKNTQFIIITHRRGSMAAADRLYGITMQEKGVSTLVSVDLVESQLDK